MYINGLLIGNSLNVNDSYSCSLINFLLFKVVHRSISEEASVIVSDTFLYMVSNQ